LAQLIGECGVHDFQVIKISDLNIENISYFSKILISPGPGLPKDFPLITKVLEKYHKHIPILGICLGHQAIGEFFGAGLVNVSRPFHGIKSSVKISDRNNYLFSGIPEYIEAGRYHSWVVDEKGLPDCLKITACSDDGLIMAISHRTYDIHGLQFHPESIMTSMGSQIIGNWLFSGYNTNTIVCRKEAK